MRIDVLGAEGELFSLRRLELFLCGTFSLVVLCLLHRLPELLDFFFDLLVDSSIIIVQVRVNDVRDCRRFRAELTDMAGLPRHLLDEIIIDEDFRHLFCVGPSRRKHDSLLALLAAEHFEVDGLSCVDFSLLGTLELRRLADEFTGLDEVGPVILLRPLDKVEDFALLKAQCGAGFAEVIHR